MLPQARIISARAPSPTAPVTTTAATPTATPVAASRLRVWCARSTGARAPVAEERGRSLTRQGLQRGGAARRAAPAGPRRRRGRSPPTARARAGRPPTRRPGTSSRSRSATATAPAHAQRGPPQPAQRAWSRRSRPGSGARCPRGRAPTARRSPISPARSLTESSISARGDRAAGQQRHGRHERQEDERGRSAPAPPCVLDLRRA